MTLWKMLEQKIFNGVLLVNAHTYTRAHTSMTCFQLLV